MAAGSTYTPIATTTLGSAASTVTLSSIPSTYTDVILVCAGSASGDGVALRFTFNSDSGANYSQTYIEGNGTSASSSRQSSQSYLQLTNWYISSGSSNSQIHLQNYSNTTTYKTVLARKTNVETAGANVGLWRSTSAINSITIVTSSGTISAGSTFTLYGIAAA
jgi:hypothetical protein